jgi:hypothetical protein
MLHHLYLEDFPHTPVSVQQAVESFITSCLLSYHPVAVHLKERVDDK